MVLDVLVWILASPEARRMGDINHDNIDDILKIIGISFFIKNCLKFYKNMFLLINKKHE
jgi:hypothetical protein